MDETMRISRSKVGMVDQLRVFQKVVPKDVTVEDVLVSEAEFLEEDDDDSAGGGAPSDVDDSALSA